MIDDKRMTEIENATKPKKKPQTNDGTPNTEIEAKADEI